MPDSHDYPLAEVIGSGDLIHQARPAALFGSRIRVETRCGMEGNRTGRDGGAWCPECVALERAETDTHDERGGDEAAVLLAIRRRALTAATYAEWLQVGRDIETLGQKLAAATARAEKAERQMYLIIGAVERAYALNAYVELEPGETAPTVESLWAEVREIRGVTPGAAPEARSEPVERSETSGGHGEGSNSSAGTAGLSEVEHKTTTCGYLACGYPEHQRNDTTEDGQHG